MGIEPKIALGSLAWPTALALLMWGLTQVGVTFPPAIIDGAIIAGAIGLLLASALWCHIAWVWLRSKGLQLGPAIVIACVLVLLVGGGIWGAFTWKPSGKKTGPTTAAFVVEFPDTANDLSPMPGDQFSARVNYGVNGGALADCVSEWTFGFKVTNRYRILPRE